MTTYVKRISNDKKRRYQEAVPVNPPSPMKNQKLATLMSTPNNSVFSLTEEAYTMELDGWEGYGEDHPSHAQSTVAKDGAAAVKPSDPVLHYWMENHRDNYLQLLLWHDGRGAMDSDTCPECAVGENAALYRCEDCMDPRLLCQECRVTAHRRQPLHHILRWNGLFFVRTSLKVLGLRIQFGHGRDRCVRPLPGHKDFVVLDQNGIHKVAVDFCGCERREDEFKQLLRCRWFPATTGRPQTCATFQCLELFHTLSLQAKTTAYDFYTALEIRTNGCGLKPPNRYPALLRMMREYRHVVLLKRKRRFGHDGSRASDTARRMVSSERRDPALGAGWAYMVETAPYRAYLLTMTDQKEMSTCSGLAALDYANAKFSRGYSATGVGMGLALEFVRFVVPKMHINGHTLVCQVKYSLNLVPGSGQTDAEGIEQAWAVVGGLAGSTRLMGPGSRSDALDDHWGYWNWRKVLGLDTLAATLRRRLDVAEAELAKQKEAFEHFSEEQAESIDEWRDMVEDFEADGSKKNPYESTMKGLTEAQVRGKLEEEEEKEEANQRRARIHKVGPVAFVVTGLEAEDEHIQRLRGLQATYTPAALVRLEALSLAEDILPEDIPLLLPSGLMQPAVTRGLVDANDMLLELLSVEGKLRDAQCRTALVRLRNQLHIKARLLLYKRNHSRHQTMNTRSRAVVGRNEAHIRLHSEKYQMAWNALRWIVGGVEGDVGWTKLEKTDICCMQEAETFSRKEAQRQQKERRQSEREARLRAEGELGPIPVEGDEMEVDVNEEAGERFTEGQNRTIMSWIWRSTGSEETDAEIREALQIEWCKAWARVRRWDEEYEEEEWKTRASKVPLDSIPTQEAEGMMAYALKQASMSEERLGRGYRRRRYYLAEQGFASELGPAEEAGDVSNSEGEDERGDLDSEEELLVGGELDDD
ncbi:hypothetical protein C8F01DRAFT_1085756 [Mycena amicta]|nr:hypothetical protein C8F01DRAFT_1085756 [Mycena amicta]